MKKVLNFIIIVVCIMSIFSTFLIISCCEKQQNSHQKTYERVEITRGVDKFIDNEYNNVCYIYYGNSISCLPIRNGKEAQ